MNRWRARRARRLVARILVSRGCYRRYVLSDEPAWLFRAQDIWARGYPPHDQATWLEYNRRVARPALRRLRREEQQAS